MAEKVTQKIPKKTPVKMEKSKAPEKGNDVDQKNGKDSTNQILSSMQLPQRVVLQIADEVVKRIKRDRVPKKAPVKKIENPIFLDTSAIIDGRVFDLIRLGVFSNNFVIIQGVLDELKHIADSKDDIKKERGKKALTMLNEFKKIKGVKSVVIDDLRGEKPVDDSLISMAKKHKGKIITCDFNLSKKAQISNVVSIDLYEMANVLKTTALPGETFFIKIIQKGKGEAQGVGYLPDGTMVVVEQGEKLIGNSVKVIISRVIQTEAGRIFFSKITS